MATGGGSGDVTGDSASTPSRVSIAGWGGSWVLKTPKECSRRSPPRVTCGVMSFVAPDAAWELRSGIFQGTEAIRGFLEGWLGSYEDHRVEAEEILDLGHGVVFHMGERQDQVDERVFRP